MICILQVSKAHAVVSKAFFSYKSRLGQGGKNLIINRPCLDISIYNKLLKAYAKKVIALFLCQLCLHVHVFSTVMRCHGGLMHAQ